MIGKLIKAFAIIILIACIALSLFYGLQLLENIDEGVGLVVILAGCIVGLFSFAMLFGYGHLIDTNAEGLTAQNEPEENPDRAHYDSLSEIKLGHLFAAEVLKFCK